MEAAVVGSRQRIKLADARLNDSDEADVDSCPKTTDLRHP